jgi:hypothetical protein
LPDEGKHVREKWAVQVAAAEPQTDAGHRSQQFQAFIGDSGEGER